MKTIATFSIVARDPLTQELGIAVQSKFLAVGSAVPWAKANVGAIATQAMANLDIGELGLHLLAKGYSAQQTAEALKQLDDNIEHRQFGIVDAKGNAVSFTGSQCFDYAGGYAEENLAVQGNILVSKATVDALRDTFKNTEGSLAFRLISALQAAQVAGGDKRGRQSASLYIVKEKGSYGGYNDRYIDLRVDDDPEPIDKLMDLYRLHQLYFTKPTEKDLLIITPELALSMQDALSNLGYYQGAHTGVFDELTRVAYESFCGWENFEERVVSEAKIDRSVYAHLLQLSQSKGS
jgi:uncharacterized Ntn-hydrolase superfamily protein